MEHFWFGLARGRALALRMLPALLLTAWMAGCAGQMATPSTSAMPTATSVVALTRSASSPTSIPQAGGQVDAAGEDSADGVITLSWWTPEFLSLQESQPAGPILAEQLAEFERVSAGRFHVNPIPKMRYGKGGLLDLLRTAQPVAPGILPDIVTLDVSELEQAVALGLLQPLDGHLSAETTDGLYAFARSAGEFHGQLLAVQYLANFEHVAYLTGAIPAPPQTWADLLGLDTQSYLFALAAPQPSANMSGYQSLQLTVLSQYLAAGATLDPDNRQLALEQEPLLRLLDFYRQAADGGLLPPNAIELGNLDAVWDIFAQGRLPMAQINARRYLAEGKSLTDVRFAATPGWSAPAVPVAGGWALAVVTADPERQRIAADLIAWLLEPGNAGVLAAAAGWLPSSPAALATWERTPYVEFADDQLGAAVSQPVRLEDSQAIERLQKAIMAVVSEGVSPQAAAAAALMQQ